jgi:hypothetical protein
VEKPRPADGQAAGLSVVQRCSAAWPRFWLAALGGLAVLSLVALVPMSALSGQFSNGVGDVVIGVPCVGVGLVVAWRQPRNPLGWLFLLTAVCLLFADDAGGYAYLVYRSGHHLQLGPAALAMEQLWPAGLVLFVAVILLFPDGTLPSPFSRWAMTAFSGLYLVLLAVLAVETGVALAAHPIRVDVGGGLSALDHPGGWFAPILAAVLVLALSVIARQVLSWRRSSGERRQQLKWLASGAAVAIVSAVLAVAFIATGPSSTLREWVDNLLWFGLAALPVSMGVAILRYRLYDIDRIISRTLAYTVVTGLLVGVYAGLVLLATGVLRFTDSVAVAASTLAAAAAFSPLRRRVQRVVDRQFNRARYDADVTLAAFAARLKDEVDLDSIRNDLAAVVQKTLEPVHISVWIRNPEEASSSGPAEIQP